MHLTLWGLAPTDPLDNLFDEPLSERLQAGPIGDDLGGVETYELRDAAGAASVLLYLRPGR